MNLSDYDYDLPDDRIAQYPAEQRDASRLMVLDREDHEIRHQTFRELPGLLSPGDCLVVNETQVSPARLVGNRLGSGGSVELLLIREEGELWEVLARPGRRLKVGAEVEFPGEDLLAKVEDVTPSGRRMVSFHGEAHLLEAVERIGRIPLPPYIKREGEPDDRTRYQTVYARTPGAVAAPTAGLHFTEDLLEAIRSKGVMVAPILLHVGPGTFKPVAVDDPREHEMDSEYYEISEDTADKVNMCRRNGGRVVAVGTTVTRTLESAASHRDGTWVLNAEKGWTSLFIYPPHTFKLTQGLITNFHLPRSTLLMLVSAFAGHEFIMRSYETAKEKDYRFYSYGDAMAIM